MGWSDKTVAPIAERAALAAIRADSDDPWAHHALGCTHLFARRLDDSIAEFETALRLNPNFSLAHCYYGITLADSGRWQEAEELFAVRCGSSPRDPLSAIYFGAAAFAQYIGRNYEKAMQLARESNPAPRRFRRSPAPADRRRRHGRTDRGRRGCTGGTAPRPARRFSCLDRRPNADQA